MQKSWNKYDPTKNGYERRIELINEVRQAGAILRAEPPDLVISSPERVLPELKERLKQLKAEIMRRLELEASMCRLQAADIRIPIFVSEIDAVLQVTDREIRTEAEAKQAAYRRRSDLQPERHVALHSA